MRGVSKKILSGSLLVAVVGLAGCASSGDLKELQEEVARVNSTAEQAAADASAAKADAAAARAAAEEARDTSNETNEKLDRMFKESMYK